MGRIPIGEEQNYIQRSGLVQTDQLLIALKQTLATVRTANASQSVNSGGYR